MKKIIFCLSLFLIVSCSGYEPLFSTKNLSFYIEDIQNVKNDEITRKISKNLSYNKLKANNKKNYVLKISSEKQNYITSKDSIGEAVTFEMVLNVKVDVFFNDDKKPLNSLMFKHKFNYNNQKNKFNLKQYKTSIEDNLINKISKEIIIKLQKL